MLYSTLDIGDKEYKLRLNAKNAVALEKTLGRHPLAVIMELQNESFPSTEDTCKILQASLQCYHHGITLDNVYDMYDEYIATGKSFTDIILVLVEIFKTAGFIPEDAEPADGDESKNA